MNIPIGIRKKLDRIKKKLIDEFGTSPSNTEDITENLTLPAAQLLAQPIIETITFKPQPGNYPSVGSN